MRKYIRAMLIDLAEWMAPSDNRMDEIIQTGNWEL
jgi:hypothetical protein